LVVQESIMQDCKVQYSKEDERLVEQKPAVFQPPMPRRVGANGTTKDGEVRQNNEERND
jgi:hypothetical protein